MFREKDALERKLFKWLQFAISGRGDWFITYHVRSRPPIRQVPIHFFPHLLNKFTLSIVNRGKLCLKTR